MYLHDLQQIGFLKKEIADNKLRLQQLRSRSVSSPRFEQSFTAAGGHSDPTGELAVKLAELERLLERLTLECICAVLQVQRFINTIPSSQMRIIFTERYIKCKTWLQVAYAIGEHDEQLPRLRHNRFISEQIANGRIQVRGS